MSELESTAGEDAAWASINTPLTPDALLVFCQDVERLFRINPMLTFERWERLGGGHYRCAGRNISQEEPFDFDLEFTVEPLPDGLRIDYLGKGLKTRTTLKIEPAPPDAPGRSRLTITDSYDHTLPAAERERLLHTVDRSLVVWLEYLLRYLVTWQRWSRFRWWRWYMRRVWLPMKPSGRRITYMLLWISAFEMALIALGFVIYYLEFA